MRKSTLHPVYRDTPVLYGAVLNSGQDDPTTADTEIRFERHTLALQRAAKRQAVRLVQCVPRSFPLAAIKAQPRGMLGSKLKPPDIQCGGAAASEELFT